MAAAAPAATASELAPTAGITERDALAAVKQAKRLRRPPAPLEPAGAAGPPRSHAERVFDRYDTNGSGLLEPNEAGQLVRQVGLLDLAPAELETITEALRDPETFGAIMRPYLHVLEPSG